MDRVREGLPDGQTLGTIGWMEGGRERGSGVLHIAKVENIRCRLVLISGRQIHIKH